MTRWSISKTLITCCKSSPNLRPRMLWSHIARRYMFSPKSHSTINVIAAVSVIAVAIPTAAMVILLSMFNGLSTTIEELYATVDADIEIVADRGQTFRRDEIDVEAVEQVEGICGVTSYLEQQVLIAANGRRTAVMLRGVDEDYDEVFDIQSYVYHGSIESILQGDIVLGSNVASTIGAYAVGCEVEMYALNRKQVSTVLPTAGISRRVARLGGVVATNADIDATLALLSVERAQQLLNYEGRITTIALRLLPDADVERVRNCVQQVVGEEFRVVTRDEKHASMNSIISMERFVIILIGGLIVLIATFAMVGAVVMLITDKQRDISILKSMGASERLVRRVFIGEGMMLCGVGCIAGIVLGVAFCLMQQHFGIIRMPQEMIIEFYPVEVRVTDILLIMGVVMGMGLLVTYVSVKATLNRNRLQR